ncbi:hypothetical protein JTE90_023307 [Oedothorax gibbosus]|uniref:Uncharacterized protein n=1 Tax=Oedothorax gibbosus TaxID=931172 RepID=A0AAV6UPH6_9ARAC|nr:hypothetical protein JTE90_023307 [Oedothorax gibbosus]
MKLELNSLLEEINSWKTLLKAKDEEIEYLHGQLSFMQGQNKTLEETQANLLQEISQFNSALSVLHNSISKLENHEAEKKILLLEKENMKVVLDEQKALHQKEIEEFRKGIQNIKLQHADELERQKSEAIHNSSSKVEKYLLRISEKESIILKLEENISKLKTENNSETLRIKVEYEEKISKLKSRLAKPKGSHSLNDDFKKDDIFRQKYIKIEKESKEEIMKLQGQIKELQAQMNLMKNGNRPLNRQAYVLNDVRNENNGASSYKEESSHHFKRLKTCSDQRDEFEDFNMGKNQADLVKPVKKKLFNLDMNYFVK